MRLNTRLNMRQGIGWLTEHNERRPVSFHTERLENRNENKKWCFKIESLYYTVIDNQYMYWYLNAMDWIVYPPKFICWSLNTRGDSNWRWGLGAVIRVDEVIRVKSSNKEEEKDVSDSVSVSLCFCLSLSFHPTLTTHTKEEVIGVRSEMAAAYKPRDEA